MQQDEMIQKINRLFKVPDSVADKVQILGERVRGGYVVIETRPQWDGASAPWTQSEITKIIFHKPTKVWKIYWRRASGRWELYGKYKSFDGALSAVETDRYGCFWG